MIAKGKRWLAFAICLCMLLCLMSGCGEEVRKRPKYEKPSTFVSVESGTIAENNGYTLQWDDTYKSVMMYSKEGDLTWGTTPIGFYELEQTNNRLSSPIMIDVVNVSSLQLSEGSAYTDCIKEGFVSATKIDNGIEVTYYFDSVQISIPVQYVLRGDSVAVSVDTTRIAEGDANQLVSISLAPYMCSTILTEDEGKTDTTLEDYLFVPAGNGALASLAIKDGERSFSAPVYGADASRFLPYNFYDKESVKMPVFGIKKGDDALVGIMEQGAELADITMTAGKSTSFTVKEKVYDEDTGEEKEKRVRKTVISSNAAAKFNVRGYDQYAPEVATYISEMQTRYSKDMVDTTVSVGFYPLSGEEANYMGMANKYRQYLQNNGLTKKTATQNAYALSILGNITTKSLAFGVPYYSTKSMTTFNAAASMIQELTKESGSVPSVQLVGYGESGMDVGQVAGGFKFAGVSGSAKDYAALTSYASENGVPLFTDFDLVYFDESGGGFSASSDAAKTATLHKSEVYHRMLALRMYDKDLGAFRLLNRSKLLKAMDKLLDKGEKLGVTGYSFGTLGYTAYSDYSSPEHQVKKNMGQDVQSMFASVTQSGHAVSTDNANAYALMASDTVFNIEINPQYNNAFDEYIPFYQIVFRGYVSMYSEALNLSSDYDTSVLHALASGVGLGYSLLDTYDVSYAASTQTGLYGSVYSSNREQIVATVTEYSDYYAAISDATITNYTVQDNGVTVTTFSNGVVAYTNPSSTTQVYPNGELGAMGFTYEQGGTNG